LEGEELNADPTVLAIGEVVSMESGRDRQQPNWLPIVHLLCKRPFSQEGIEIASKLLNDIAVFLILQF
jgi:hypothetical protein